MKPSRSFLIECMLLVCMIGIAAWLRFPGLGELSFYGDEDYSYLAAKSILETGFPAMPSGMNYFRGIPYSYISALFASVLGINEMSLRIPSAIFGVLAIPVLYFLAKKIAGLIPAVTASWLFVFSAWHIDMSREARMYSMFLTFSLVTLLLYVIGFYYEKKPFKILAVFAAVITIPIHSLSLLLVIMWSVPIFFRHTLSRNRISLLMTTSILFLFSLTINKIISFSYQEASNYGSQAMESMTTQFSEAGFIQSSIGAYLKIVPRFNMLSHIISNNPMLFILSAAGVACVAAAFMYHRRLKLKTSYQQIIFTFILLALAVTNLFSLAILIIVLLFVWDRSAARAWVTCSTSHYLVGMIFSIFVLWLCYGILVWKGADFGEIAGSELVRKIIKDSFSFPVLHVITYIESFPVMTSISCFGSLYWALYYKSDRKNYDLENLLFSWFWLILFAMGFAREWIALRYTVMLYPVYLMMFSWSIYHFVYTVYKRKLGGTAADVIWTKTYGLVGGTALSFFLLVFPVINEAHSIEEAINTSKLSYGQSISLLYHGYPFHPDHQGAGLYIKENLSDDDIIIAMDIFQQYVYIGRVDYWLIDEKTATRYGYQLDNKRYDIYTNTETIETRKELKEILDLNQERRVWIITSAERTEKNEGGIPAGVKEFLSSSHQQLEFVGRDGKTRVYQF